MMIAWIEFVLAVTALIGAVFFGLASFWISRHCQDMGCIGALLGFMLAVILFFLSLFIIPAIGLLKRKRWAGFVNLALVLLYAGIFLFHYHGALKNEQAHRQRKAKVLRMQEYAVRTNIRFENLHVANVEPAADAGPSQRAFADSSLKTYEGARIIDLGEIVEVVIPAQAAGILSPNNPNQDSVADFLWDLCSKYRLIHDREFASNVSIPGGPFIEIHLRYGQLLRVRITEGIPSTLTMWTNKGVRVGTWGLSKIKKGGTASIDF